MIIMKRERERERERRRKKKKKKKRRRRSGAEHLGGAPAPAGRVNDMTSVDSE